MCTVNAGTASVYGALDQPEAIAFFGAPVEHIEEGIAVELVDQRGISPEGVKVNRPGRAAWAAIRHEPLTVRPRGSRKRFPAR
jgi:hypothetical protein